MKIIFYQVVNYVIKWHWQAWIIISKGGKLLYDKTVFDGYKLHILKPNIIYRAGKVYIADCTAKYNKGKGGYRCNVASTIRYDAKVKGCKWIMRVRRCGRYVILCQRNPAKSPIEFTAPRLACHLILFPDSLTF